MCMYAHLYRHRLQICILRSESSLSSEQEGGGVQGNLIQVIRLVKAFTSEPSHYVSILNLSFYWFLNGSIVFARILELHSTQYFQTDIFISNIHVCKDHGGNVRNELWNE